MDRSPLRGPPLVAKPEDEVDDSTRPTPTKQMQQQQQPEKVFDLLTGSQSLGFYEQRGARTNDDQEVQQFTQMLDDRQQLPPYNPIAERDDPLVSSPIDPVYNQPDVSGIEIENSQPVEDRRRRSTTAKHALVLSSDSSSSDDEDVLSQAIVPSSTTKAKATTIPHVVPKTPSSLSSSSSFSFMDPPAKTTSTNTKTPSSTSKKGLVLFPDQRSNVFAKNMISQDDDYENDEDFKRMMAASELPTGKGKGKGKGRRKNQTPTRHENRHEDASAAPTNPFTLNGHQMDVVEDDDEYGQGIIYYFFT